MECLGQEQLYGTFLKCQALVCVGTFDRKSHKDTRSAVYRVFLIFRNHSGMIIR